MTGAVSLGSAGACLLGDRGSFLPLIQRQEPMN